jgi:mRNA interferase MazF
MVMSAVIPEQGDFVTLSFDPQAGHEQRGRRPALVISKRAFNQATGMTICCPITHTHRGIPFHVAIPVTAGLSGFVMAEQVKSLDFRSRSGQIIGRAPDAVINEVLAILDACLY